MTVSTLPAVEEIVTTAYIGRPERGHGCYAAVGTWVENNGYQIVGQGREVYIVPPLPGKEDETVIEIQYPIQQVESVTPLLN